MVNILQVSDKVTDYQPDSKKPIERQPVLQ